MKDLVCTVATAKKLATVDAISSTHFYWALFGKEWKVVTKAEAASADEAYPAPTSSEASRLYPEELWITVEHGMKKKEGAFFFAKIKGIYKVSLMVKANGSPDLTEIYREEDHNEAEARCRMLYHIVENKM